MALLTLTLLGGFDARVGPRPIRLASRKARALLAFLALPPGRTHARDKLAALLWGETAESQARNSLRQCLFGIRRTLAAHRVPALILDGESVALNPETVRVDVADFAVLARATAAEGIERGLTLYRGALLDGVALREPAFEDWLLAERRLLAETAASALARLVERYRAAGLAEEAIRAGIRLVALDPLAEPAHRTLMRLYAGLGRRGPALRQYQACADVLRRELGVEPDGETQALYREILRRRVEPAAAAAPLARGDGLARRSSRAPRSAIHGRESEVTRLREAMRAAAAGRGQVVLLLGEAGIGKSRLAEEVVGHARAAGWVSIAGRSYETEQLLALGVWAGALRTAAPASLSEVAAALGAAAVRDLAQLLPGVIEPVGKAPRAAASERRLFEAVALLLDRLAATVPLLVVLEDLHWADEASLRLTAFLARRLEHRAILVLATARVEELDEAPMLRRVRGELGREQRLTEILLPPLARDAVDRLVRALVGSATPETTRAALCERVWRISEGNPFIAVECVRARQEGISVEPEAGTGLPARARTMLLGRIERLGEQSRALLEAAAVIGRDFEFELVQRAAGLDEPAAAHALEELVRRRLVHGVDERFDFTHDRIWEVVSEQLPPLRRRLLHGAVARAIEALHAAELGPHHAALGVHWSKAQAWDRAVTHLRAAGTQAASRGAYREAVALFEEALRALERLPQTDEAIATAVDLRIDLRDWLLPLGELGRLAAYAREGERLAARLPDPRRLAVVRGHLAHYHWAIGEQDRAMDYARRMLAMADEIGDPGLVTAGRFYLGEVCYAVGDVRRAVDVLRENASITGERMVERLAGPGLVPIMSRAWFAFALVELGRFDEAIACLEEARPVVETIEHPYSLMRIHFALGLVHLERGHLARALPALERASALVERWDIALDRPANASALGLAYVLSGRCEVGLALLERSVERLVPPRSGAALIRRRGEGCLAAGRLDEALGCAHTALEHARRCGARGEEGWALLLSADALAAGSVRAASRAAALYEEAGARADELGMSVLRARCDLGTGVLHVAAGRPERAHAALGRAVASMRAMELGLWRDRAEAMLAALVPRAVAPRA